MTGPCFRFLWQEPEYSTVDENLVFHLKDDAPEIAKKSYKEYQRYYSKEMDSILCRRLTRRRLQVRGVEKARISFNCRKGLIILRTG